MIIKVTDSHIKKGKRGNRVDCPIALAIADSGLYSYVRVYNWSCLLVKEGWPTSESQLPLEAVKFIKSFDRGEPVAPFEFELKV